MMRAGLEGDVKCGAPGAFARLIQCQDFGVLYLRVCVIAASHDLAVAHQYRADRGIGTCATRATPRQFQRFIHPRIAHVAKRDAMNLSGSKGSRSAACSPTPT